ncbi:unnamed protein product [Didymodactylos carnosus]|uniref:Uncharacterized protein n=1 Tax=Didymodactylos carnosus TaxID=1234261 RepID=A0A815A1Y1_9BILA|nr:unnamed protein product [Didymodactylos carnosus]CAF4017864.1 unnamed protein product [Didymodactylos carnosus]
MSDKIDFCEGDIYFTSTPIPPSLTEVDSDEEYSYFLRPVSNHIDSSEKHSSSPLTLLQTHRLREPISLDEDCNLFLISGSKRPNSPIDKTSAAIAHITDADNDEDHSDSFEDATIHLSDTSIIADIKKNAKIDVAGPEPFTSIRQQTIDNSNCRIILQAWRPNSVERLV